MRRGELRASADRARAVTAARELGDLGDGATSERLLALNVERAQPSAPRGDRNG